MQAVIATEWGLDLNHVEDVNRRTRHSMLFARPDGKKVSFFSSNLFYQVRPNEWEPEILDFVLAGADQVVTRHWFHTRINDTGLAIFDPSTGVGVRWRTPARPVVRGRLAKLSGDGVEWTWSVGPRRLKLSGIVVAPLGVRTHVFTYQPMGASQDFTIVDGHAVAPGIRVHAPTVTGADGVRYPASGWTLLPGPRIGFSFDDRLLPPAAYPYVIDPTTTLQPDSTGFDTQIIDTTPTTNFGTNVNIYTGDGSSTSSDATRILIKYDVSSIPSGDAVTAATFSLYENDANSGNGGPINGDIDLQKLRRDWVEAQTTWNIWSTGNNWTTAGAADITNDLYAAVSATVNLDNVAAAAFVDWTGATLTDDVQSFVNGSLSNYGWRMKSTKDNAGVSPRGYNQFSSSDNVTASQRPKLVVTHAESSAGQWAATQPLWAMQPVQIPVDVVPY